MHKASRHPSHRAGLLLSALFFLYEGTTNKYNRKVERELVLGGTAALTMGLGTLFTLLWLGE